jgi:DNA-binding PadR family transcriptional regulator
MTLENGILGFLAIKPLSGYDIKKLFDMAAGYFWPADQTQIYRTLKRLVKEEMIILKGTTKGETVDRIVYEITDKGRDENLAEVQQNTMEDFITREAFLMQLFFSGALTGDELDRFLDTQIRNINELERKLVANYDENFESFLSATGLSEDDIRVKSAVWTHQWGLIQCREYAKFLRQIKKRQKSE